MMVPPPPWPSEVRRTEQQRRRRGQAKLLVGARSKQRMLFYFMFVASFISLNAEAHTDASQILPQGAESCTQALSLLLPGQVWGVTKVPRTSDQLALLGLRLVNVEAIDGACDRLGEDVLGTLGISPKVWRPAMDWEGLRVAPLPRKFFTTFWHGWCVRVGYPPMACCRDDTAGDPRCFDAMHTWSRCCAGHPKAVNRLYEVSPAKQYWGSGPCSAVPPRKMFSCEHISPGRLAGCERWEGKWAFPPDVYRLAAGRITVGRAQSYEECEELALASTLMRATVIAWSPLDKSSTHAGDCAFALLSELPPQAWGSATWKLTPPELGLLSTVCLPLAHSTGTEQDQLAREQALLAAAQPADREAMLRLAETAQQLSRWAAGASDSQEGAGKKDTTGQAQLQAQPLQAEDRSFDATTAVQNRGYCLITPTHSPHYANLVTLLRAVDALALDAIEARPRHLIVFDTDSDIAEFCSLNAKVCEQANTQKQPHIDSGRTPLETARLWLLSLKALVEGRGESFEDLRKSRESWKSRQFGACRTGWGQVYQGLKKIYGMLHGEASLGCRLFWAMDSESFPLQFFEFSQIFRSFEERPFVQIQDYSPMAGSFGAPQLMMQECAHWLVTHKLRLAPAGAVGYRPSDFWIYNATSIRRFVEDLTSRWGHGAVFSDLWMRPPCHGEGAILPAWLHLRSAGGGAPNYHDPDLAASSDHLSVLDVAAAVQTALPGLYERICRTALFSPHFGPETDCLDEFAVVARAHHVLQLPTDPTALEGRLEAGKEACQDDLPACDFLRVLSVLDGLPIYGLQGHGKAMRLVTQWPFLIRFWRRAPQWCLSNCDAEVSGRRLWAYLDLDSRQQNSGNGSGKAVIGDRRASQAASNGPPSLLPLQELLLPEDRSSSSSSGGTEAKLQEEPMLLQPPKIASGNSTLREQTLRCFQWHMTPEDVDVKAWHSWDSCLDIVHLDAGVPR